jgi:ADP-heptose:LPS heptosyltransferase
LFLNPTIRRLKKENFDLVVALGGYSSRLAKKTYFLNAKYSVGIGSDKYIFDLVYDKAVIFKKKNFKNHIEEMAALIRASGLSIPKKLPYTNLGLQNRPHKNWLAICPSSNRSESVYPPNLYVEVIKKILKGGKFKKITLFTMNAESSFKILTDYGCNHIVTDNLKLFINELSKYQYVLTSEGGTAHIAGALHLSVFIISGTKNQFFWNPHAKNIKTFVNTNSVNKINPELIAKALYKF